MKQKSPNYSRRAFLRIAGAAATGLTLLPRNAFAQDDERSFNMLVLGDSVISGQGLREEQKFYYLVKEWLETEAFRGSRKVNLEVKAHSGANINLKPADAAGLKRAGIDESQSFPVEINIPFPSISTQVENARTKYEDPRAVDLILLTGGITDVRVSTILDPFKKNEDLRESIVRHCYEDMLALLTRIAEAFPNALIAVVGYYPMLSKHTPRSKIFNHVMKLRDVAGPLQPLINNAINRRLLKYYTNKMIRRSLIWAEDSTLEFGRAVEKLNAAQGTRRAVFIESPIKEANSLGAKNTLLFELGKKGKAADPLAAQRSAACNEEMPRLAKATGLRFDTVSCEIASIGHPNTVGAKLTAAAIAQELKNSNYFVKLES